MAQAECQAASEKVASLHSAHCSLENEARTDAENMAKLLSHTESMLAASKESLDSSLLHMQAQYQESHRLLVDENSQLNAKLKDAEATTQRHKEEVRSLVGYLPYYLATISTSNAVHLTCNCTSRYISLYLAASRLLHVSEKQKRRLAQCFAQC